MSRFDDVVVEGIYVAQTAAAVLIRPDPTGEPDYEVWFPLSQVSNLESLNLYLEDAERGETELALLVPRWLAEEKEVDYDE